MLQRARSIKPINNVIASRLSAQCTAANHPFTFIGLRNTRHVSFTPPRPVSIFLPHESLALKVATAAPSTSIVATHYDLASYLRFHTARCTAQTDADKRVKLSQSSVYLGTRYEYLIQQHLTSNLGFSLTRIGGKGDGGVDLIGTWKVPGAGTGAGGDETFKILVQAKRLTTHRKPMPALMRELEGTLMGSRSSRALGQAFAAHQIRVRSQMSTTPLSESSTKSATKPGPKARSTKSPGKLPPDTLPTLGILITTRPLTNGIEKAMASSRRCLMYMCLEESLPTPSSTTTNSPTGTESDPVPSTRIRQIAWNAAASRAGLEGYAVVTRYSDSDSDASADVAGKGEAMSGEATLMYQGRPVVFRR